MSFIDKMRTSAEGHIGGQEPSQYKSVVPYAVLAFVALLPLVSLVFQGVPALTAKGGFVVLGTLIIFAIWLGIQLRVGQVVVPKSLLLAATGGLTFVYLLATLFSESIGKSFVGMGSESHTFIAFFGLAILTYLVSATHQSNKRIYTFYLVLLGTAFVVALYQVIRLSLSGAMAGLPANLIGSFNDFAIYFGLIAVVTLATLELVQLAKRMRNIFIGMLGISLVMMMLANFKLAWVVMAVFALLVLVYTMSFGGKSGGEERAIPKFSLGVVIISVLFVLASSPVGSFMQNTFNVSNLEIRPSWIGTTEVIKDALAEDPIFGVGPNRFSSAWLAYKPEGINQTIMWNVDFNSGVGVVPSSVVATGILGLIAWIIFYGALLLRSSQLVIKAGRESDKVTRFAMVSSLLATMFMWTFVLFYVPNILNMSLAFIFTGLSVAALAQRGVVRNWNIAVLDDPRISFISVLVLILLLVSSVGTGYVVLKRNMAAADYYDHLAALTVADIASAESALQSAIDKHESDMYYRDLSAVYLARLSEILASSDSEEVVKTQFQNISSLAIQSALRATEIDESNYLNWVALSRAYSSLIQFGLPQGYENATEANNRALARNPHNPSIHLSQAQLELINGDRAKAKEALNKALDLKGNYTEAIFLLAQIQADEGNIAEAIQSTEVASLVAPNDFGVFFQLGFLKYTNEDYAGAVPAFARAIELNPVYANAMYFLGLSLYETGNSADAITVFERVQQLNPENEEVRDILNNLRSGKAPFGDSRRTPPEERRELPVAESPAVTPDEIGDELADEPVAEEETE